MTPLGRVTLARAMSLWRNGMWKVWLVRFGVAVLLRFRSLSVGVQTLLSYRDSIT